MHTIMSLNTTCCDYYWLQEYCTYCSVLRTVVGYVQAHRWSISGEGEKGWVKMSPELVDKSFEEDELTGMVYDPPVVPSRKMLINLHSILLTKY